MADMLQLVAPALESVQTHRCCCCCRSFLPAPQNGLQIEGGGLSGAELCVCEGCSEIHIFLVMRFMSHGAVV